MRRAVRRALAALGLAVATALSAGCGERPPSYLPMGGPTARSAVVELDTARRPHWAMQGGDHRRSGVALDPGPQQIRRLWTAVVPPPGPAQVAIAADGTVYLAGGEDDGWHLVAISATGRGLWANNLGAAGPFTPALDPRGEVVYALAGAPGPYLLAFNTDGSRRWELDLGALVGWPEGKAFWHAGRPANPAPLVGEDGAVFVAAGAGVVAVEPTGQVRWTWRGDADAPVAEMATMAMGPDQTLYAPARLADGSWALVHLTTYGETHWVHPLPGRPSTPAVGMDGLAHVVVRDEGGFRMVAVRINGKQRWTHALELPWAEAAAVAAADAMPALAWDALVGNLVVSSGGARAMQLQDGLAPASPVALDTANRRYLVAQQGSDWFLTVVAGGGSVVQTEAIGPAASYPAVGAGRVYVVEQVGDEARLVAFGAPD